MARYWNYFDVPDAYDDMGVTDSKAADPNAPPTNTSTSTSTPAPYQPTTSSQSTDEPAGMVSVTPQPTGTTAAPPMPQSYMDQFTPSTAGIAAVPASVMPTTYMDAPVPSVGMTRVSPSVMPVDYIPDYTPPTTTAAPTTADASPGIAPVTSMVTDYVTDYVPDYTPPSTTPTTVGIAAVPATNTATDYVPDYTPPPSSGIAAVPTSTTSQPVDYVPGYTPPPSTTSSTSTPTTTNPSTTSSTTSASSALDLLPQLLAGVTGANNPLTTATTNAVLSQLNSPNPYNAQAVQDEYNWLAGNIDDQFARDQQALDNEMARRGLYGSAGKDFHSGRLSDLNVGKRNAKISLARALADAKAKSDAGYTSNAIAQAQTAQNASNANALNYLNAIMGFGQNAFNNDLATAQFNNQLSTQDLNFLLQLLAAGYGA